MPIYKSKVHDGYKNRKQWIFFLTIQKSIKSDNNKKI